MKKILIVSHAMELGGAENALLGLLENIDTTKVEVDLFLYRHSGELLQFIPDNINLLVEKAAYACMAVPIIDVIKKKQFAVAIGRAVGKYLAKKRASKLGFKDSDIELEYSHKYTVPVMPVISEKEYDLAISFLTPHYYVMDKVKAKKKVAWIHTDYSKVQVDRDSQIQMWDLYDTIVSISDTVTESFLSIFPELKDKIELIGNILPIKYVTTKSDEFEVNEEMPSDGTIKLLSIGRFCTAKNFDNIPEICKIVRNAGVNIKWYIIGYGGDEQLIKGKIEQFGMQEHVIILGKKTNPYPYIKQCDLYVQPSRYEGKCVSVIEAQALHKPVIISNYSTASSQLKDGVDGIIVSQNIRECATMIADIVKDRELQAKLILNTQKVDYSNADEIQKVYSLI